MKKVKLLTPILGLSTLTSVLLPLISTSCSKASNIRKIILVDQDEKDFKMENRPLKDGRLLINLKPSKDEWQVNEINKIMLGGYQIDDSERDFNKKSGYIIIHKNALDSHRGDVQIHLTISNKQPILNDLKYEQVNKTHQKIYFKGDKVSSKDFKIMALYKYGKEPKQLEPALDGKAGYTVFTYENEKDVTKEFVDGNIVINDSNVNNSYKYLTIRYSEPDEYGGIVNIEKTLEIDVANELIIYHNHANLEFDVGDTFKKDGLQVKAKGKNGKIQDIGLSDSNLKFMIGSDSLDSRFKFEDKHYGKQEVTVSYNGKSAKYIINVQDQRDHSVIVKNIGEGEATLTITTTKTNFPDIQYNTSLDAKIDWTQIGEGSQTHKITIKQNEGILLKGNNSGMSGCNLKFTGEKAKIEISGKSCGLLNNATRDAKIYDNCFENLFADSTALYSVDENFISTGEVKDSCYKGMFKGCTNLTKGPDLKATSLLGKHCYESMFEDCSSLENAPKLPLKIEMKNNCFKAMFKGCTSLKEAPQIGAVAMGQNCCESMFENCTSLTETPKLLSNTLADECYKAMFKGCTGLKSIGLMTISSAKNKICYEMFSGCTNLFILNQKTNESTLFFTCPEYSGSVDKPFDDMFKDCQGDITTPDKNTKYYFKNQK